MALMGIPFISQPFLLLVSSLCSSLSFYLFMQRSPPHTLQFYVFFLNSRSFMRILLTAKPPSYSGKLHKPSLTARVQLLHQSAINAKPAARNSCCSLLIFKAQPFESNRPRGNSGVHHVKTSFKSNLSP